MQKTRKLIAMLLVVMMVLSVCTVGMLSVSALPENAVISDSESNDPSSINGEILGLMGDSDGNNTVDVKDATEIQKYAARMISLDDTAAALADVDLNGNVNIKDATGIQKWIAKIPVDMPVGQIVYIPEETTAPETTAVPVVTTTVASSDETEPATTKATVPVIIIPTTAVEPTEATTAAVTTAATTAPEPTEATTTASATTASVDETTVAPTTAATTVAETTTQPTTAAQGITVYFTNNLNWEIVRVHAWNANGDITEWPGVEMSFYKTNHLGQDMYKYTFYTDVDGVVFNGYADPEETSNKALQTTSVKGDSFKGDGYGYYCTGVTEGGKQCVDNFKVEEQQTTSIASGDEPTTVTAAATTQTVTTTQSVGTITVYFTNNRNWENVYIHYWCTGSDGTTFPGVPMTFLEKNGYNQDIYYYVVPGDTEGVNFVGVNAAGEKVDQTTSVKGDDFKGYGYGYYCADTKDTKGRWNVESYAYNVNPITSATTTAAPTTVAATTTQATTAATKPTGPITVYFTNKCGWNVVNIHCWNSTETLTVWPGARMSYYSVNQYGQTTYTYEVPAGAESISFNGYYNPSDTSKNDLQTVTITGSDLKDGYGYHPIRRGDDDRWLVVSWDEEHPEQTTTAAPTTTAAVTTVAPTTTVAATTVAPTTSVDTVTITFNGANTTWINDAGAYFVLVDLDTNESYNMTNIGNYKWTAEVPETVNNVKFERHNPDTTATKPVWNSWTANDRGTSLQYNTSSSSAGAWEGDTTVKYYVMGSFNSWSAGTPMTANADGSYTQTIALEAGTYQYKIATADYSVEYPSGYGNNATLTVATAGNYKFTLSASGQITAVAE